MKRLIYMALALALAAGCGPSVRTPRQDSEVNIGYGTVKRGDLTTSVSSLNMEKDSQTKSYADMYEYLRDGCPVSR